MQCLPHLLIGEFSWGRPVCDVTEVTWLQNRNEGKRKVTSELILIIKFTSFIMINFHFLCMDISAKCTQQTTPYLIWTNIITNKQHYSLMILNWKAMCRCMLSQRPVWMIYERQLLHSTDVSVSNTPQVEFPNYTSILSLFNTKHYSDAVGEVWLFLSQRSFHLLLPEERQSFLKPQSKPEFQAAYRIPLSPWNGSWVSQMLKPDGTN